MKLTESQQFWNNQVWQMNLQEIIFLISLLSISPSTLRCLTSSSLVISLNQDYTFEYDLSHLILFQASCPTPLLLIARTFLNTAFNSLLSLSSFLMMSSPIPPRMLCHKMKWLGVGWLGWSFNTGKGYIMDTSKDPQAIDWKLKTIDWKLKTLE